MEITHPFSFLIAGNSGSGKSTFTIQFIKHLQDLCSTKFDQIIWCLSETNAAPVELGSSVIVKKGIPEFTNEREQAKLIVLDDLMNDVYSRKVSELFTKISHHRGISVILITQNLFHSGPCSRDISLNSKYIVVFKNPRDKLQAAHLIRQVYPENWRGLHKAYLDATKNPFGYLLIDLCQNTNELLRFRTNIFEKPCTVYVPTIDDYNETIEIE